ncbi:MAG TPA: Dabb family protein [Acidobacteriota bacterium]|nr:Dabb family protein [Acidobacteriota bacterium]
MLTHIVLYKLKSGVTNEQAQALLREARTRLAAIPGVINLRAGTSIYADDVFQCALVMDFENVTALESYRVHPTHVKFVDEIVNPIAAEIRRLDYVE